MEYVSCDWKNPKDYEFQDSDRVFIWAWQFLRRNRDYQFDWEKAYQGYLDIGGDPIDKMVQTDRDFFILTSKEAEKWGITGYIDPSKPNPFPANFIRPENYRGTYVGKVYFDHKFDKYYLPDDDIRGPENIPTGYVAILIDLEVDIKSQLKIISNILLKVQEDYSFQRNTTILRTSQGVRCTSHDSKIIKDRTRLPSYKRRKTENNSDQVEDSRYSLWKRYLRVFDARERGTREKEIASELYPWSEGKDYEDKIKRVSDDYQRAKELIGGDYRRYIPL